MKVLLLGLLLTSQVLAGTKLLLIGGGKRPVQALKMFVLEAGGKKSSIVVIPWASQSVEGALNIREELLIAGAGKIEIADDKNIHHQLKKATGVFFTGGDQNKLMHEIKILGTQNLMQNLFMKGVVFAGTSAGTAIMSKSMLTGNADLSVLNGAQVERAPGLGLLKENILVDQHFVVRSRFNRLAGVILESPKELGIGIDENNALFIRDQVAQVIGPTQVLFFKILGSKEISVLALTEGDRYDLSLRKQIQK